MKTVAHLTLAAVLPHAQVNMRDIFAAVVAVWPLGHSEHVFLNAGDVVPVITENSSQRRLLQLSQLGGSEHAWAFIPESDQKQEQAMEGGQENGVSKLILIYLFKVSCIAFQL